MSWEHWVVRAAHDHRPFVRFATCSSTWAGLKTVFREALAAVLMPNHLHMILPTAERVSSRLSGVLQFAQWQKIPPGVRIHDTKHLLRQLRYVALNPSRDGLARDPLL